MLVDELVQFRGGANWLAKTWNFGVHSENRLLLIPGLGS